MNTRSEARTVFGCLVAAILFLLGSMTILAFCGCSKQPTTPPDAAITLGSSTAKVAADDMAAAPAPDAAPAAAQPALDCQIDEDLPRTERYQDCILVAASEEDVDPALVWAIMKEESGFDANLVWPQEALVGLMGISPNQMLGVKQLQDPRTNILEGVKILADLRETFPDDDRSVVLAYYAGGDAAAKDCVRDTKEVPAETQKYVSAVLAAAAEREEKLKKERHLAVRASFRSFEKQAEAYCREGADQKVLAAPGQSLHQVGLAVDVSVVDGLGHVLADLPTSSNLKSGSTTNAERARAEWLKNWMATSGWQATHWSLGEWRHFEYDNQVVVSDSKPTTAPTKFDCAAWRAGDIPAPPEPEELVTERLNAWSRQVRLTPRAFAALVAAEANVAHASRSGR